MFRLLCMTGVLALSATVTGQNYITSPSGYLNVEGDASEYVLGYYAGGRYMAFDGEQMGSAMTIKGTAYRLDNQAYNTNTGMGRSWTNVKLYMSECDMSALSRTFTANPTTTPTKVFDKSVDWPTVSGKPTKFPSDWMLSFPFATNWSYTGSNGICLDYTFTGGKLANNGAWSTSGAKAYYKDSHNPSLYSYVKSSPLGWYGNYVGCNDRGVTHLSGASVETTAYFYSDTYSDARYQGRLVFAQTGRNFGYATPVVTVLGFRSLFNGIQFPGVFCNKLHVDIGLPTMMFNQTSTTSGSLNSLAMTGGFGVKAPANLAGAELVTQAAWLDTQTRRLLFSSAAKLIVPMKPRGSKLYALYTWQDNYPTGSGPYAGHIYNPIVRYTK